MGIDCCSRAEDQKEGNTASCTGSSDIQEAGQRTEKEGYIGADGSITGCCVTDKYDDAAVAIGDADGCRECCEDYDTDVGDCCISGYTSSTTSRTILCCVTQERCDGTEKCIVAAAALECEKACNDEVHHPGATGHHHAHDENGQHPNSACTAHLHHAFNQYSAFIEQARCVCRSVLERGLSTTGTCCDAAFQNPSCGSQKPQCLMAVSTLKSQSHGHEPRPNGHCHGRARALRNKAGAGLDSPHPKPSTDNACCGHDQYDIFDFPPRSSDKFAGELRCRGHQEDIEEGGDALESVAVVVTGMTCSGCGDKLARALQAARGVSHVRVNFLMGNADFSVNPSKITADEAIRVAQGATGFRCIRKASGDHALDFLACGTAAEELAKASVDGIIDTSILDKKVVRVTYDPDIIGARDLFRVLGRHSTGLAPPEADPALARGRERLVNQGVRTSLAALLTIPVVVLAWGDALAAEKTTAVVSLVLATGVQLIAVSEFYRPAISALVTSHVLEMDMLVIISITAAYLYSIVAFAFRFADQHLETTEFFETSTLLITLILLGRLIATWTRVKAVATVSMRSLQINQALLVQRGKDSEIDVRLLQYGDQFKVFPHTRVPTDGLVVTGTSDFDESMITGESMPVLKRPGSHIIAGTINGEGTVIAQLTRLPGGNTVTDIAKMVEDATNAKPRLQDLASKVSSWFVKVVAVVAILVVVTWVVVGLEIRSKPTGTAVSDAITYAVAVMAVSCPCALGLAVPMVLVMAGGIAARGGIVIKSAECTEGARKCTDVIFDKTGTLTEAHLDVLTTEYLSIDRDQAIAVTKALVAGGKHPVSAAVAKHLENESIKSIGHIEDARNVPGVGVQAKSGGTMLRAGNARWTKTENHTSVMRLMDEGLTTLVVTRNETPLAVFGLRAQLRLEAPRVVEELKGRGIRVHLVSGDQPRAVQSVAMSVGIPREHVAAERTPVDKRVYVASIMRDRTKHVMFCGDGTNDAVAVAQAHVGVQMGGALSSSDVTQGAAGVVLLAGLDGIPFLLDVSRASYHRIVFNFVWSAVYNVFAILLASGAFVNFRLPPAYAGLGEIVSVMPVILAATSMLLLNFGRTGMAQH